MILEKDGISSQKMRDSKDLWDRFFWVPFFGCTEFPLLLVRMWDFAHNELVKVHLEIFGHSLPNKEPPWNQHGSFFIQDFKTCLANLPSYPLLENFIGEHQRRSKVAIPYQYQYKYQYKYIEFQIRYNFSMVYWSIRTASPPNFSGQASP